MAVQYCIAVLYYYGFSGQFFFLLIVLAGLKKFKNMAGNFDSNLRIKDMAF